MLLDDALTTWDLLGSVQPRALGEMRQQVRWAAQIAAAIGRSAFSETAERTMQQGQEADWAHAAFEWDFGHRALIGPQTPAGVSAALWIRELAVGLLDEQANVIEQLSLEGLSIGAALGQLSDILRTATGERPELLIPDEARDGHPLATGDAFTVDDAPLNELRCWMENGFLVVHAAIRQLDGASPARCWPHELEIGSVVQTDDDHSLNFGLRFGDRAISEPYWFVVPWPAPEGDLPMLEGGGRWFAKSFVGAVLFGSDLTSRRIASEQEARVRAFLRSALDALRR